MPLVIIVLNVTMPLNSNDAVGVVAPVW